jgi:hypothetical protein
MARGKWLSGAERKLILQLQREGLGISAIAARVNRSYHFVYRHLRDKCRVKHGRDEDDLALHQDSKRRKQGDASEDASRPMSECSPEASTWASPRCKSLVASVSPTTSECVGTASAEVRDALAAAKEVGDDSCEPLLFDALAPSGLLPFDLPSHLDKMQNASASDLLLPLEEIYDGESLQEPSAERPGSSKPYPRWMSLHEDPPVPTQSVDLIEPEQEVEIANSDLPGLHSSLQGAIRCLSRQRSISLCDAQLLQLLAQANVVLLSREQSSTRNSPTLWGCELPR